jgi:hypothetical protein
MIQFDDLIKLPVTEEDVRNALTQAIEQETIERDNLRVRSKMLRLDCRIRGYLGEIGLRNWFDGYGIEFSKANFLDDATNMDIDLLYQSKSGDCNIEVKTSTVPETYENLRGVIQKADIKIIKRTHTIEDLSGDIHIQIYFNFLRKKRDESLKGLNQQITDPQTIIRQLSLMEYVNRTYFVAWIDKPALIAHIHRLPERSRTWTFSAAQKSFWACKLATVSQKPIDIIDYLRQL